MRKLPVKIRKRDGSLVDFDDQKIKRAIYRAALEVLKEKKETEKITKVSVKGVLEKIGSLYKDEIPSVENIQDIVEEVLMETGFSWIARSYILYRQKHQDIRRVKVIYGV
ncbi:MAG: ribonucleoside-diphosphate reductase, adenosylcobalamin-dependent, partial [Candidatus Aminicenantes bacterium]|nr:ribonucleoside-diphosphate reductase, adenosylcobalamin-dependent [Candidatus Aminicenantes bacterium]